MVVLRSVGENNKRNDICKAVLSSNTKQKIISIKVQTTAQRIAFKCNK